MVSNVHTQGVYITQIYISYLHFHSIFPLSVYMQWHAQRGPFDFFDLGIRGNWDFENVPPPPNILRTPLYTCV